MSFLKHVTKVRLEFAAYDTRSRSAREFLSQITSRKAKAANPEREVVTHLRTTEPTPPVAILTYSDGTQQTIETGSTSCQEIMRQVRDQCEEMEMREVLSEAGGSIGKLYCEKELKI
eukprot:jgi/Chlat1/8125/Chrsp75S07559